MGSTAASPSAPVPPLPLTVARRDRLFYTGIALVSALIVIVGFSNGLRMRTAHGAPPLSLLVTVHATVFIGWIVLFIAQTRLVATGRVHIHQKLGIVGATVAAVMLVLGYATAIAAARHGYNPARDAFPGALGFLVVPLTDLVVFGTFVTLAVLNRRRPEVHKRLMVIALVGGLLPAAITRLPFVVGHVPAIIGVQFAVLAAGPVYDLISRGRIHKVYAWGATLAFLSGPLRIAIGQTDAWHSLAAWLV